MPNKKSGKQWLKTHQKDAFARQARESYYRSRAVFKLKEIDQKDKLFQQGQSVVDLGAAPGSWSQYASEQIGSEGHVVAVDMLTMDALPRVEFIQGDIADLETEEKCVNSLGKAGADLVISDMAPNLTGIRVMDQARSMALAEFVFEFCQRVLNPGGGFLIKLFEGVGTREYRQLLQEHFKQVVTRKPVASRDQSREFYVLARFYGL